MAIALVRLVGDDRSDVNTCDRNIGLGYLAIAVMDAGFTVEIFDPIDVDQTNLGKCVQLFVSFDIVGFTVHCLNVEVTLSFIQQLKQHRSDLLVILGGHHAAATAPDLLSDYEEIDAIFVGHSEGSIVRFCRDSENYRRGKGRNGHIVFSDKVTSLDALGSPFRPSLGKIERISTSRGCPYSCTFCTTPAMILLSGESAYSFRSQNSIMEELEFLVAAGVRHVYFNDDLFVVGNTRSVRRAELLARNIIASDLRLTFKTQLRVDSFAPENQGVLSLLYKAGMREVFLGLESGSPNTLSEYQKDTSVDQNIRAVRMFEEIGIKVNAGNIAASPSSTLSDFLATVNMFSKLDLAFLLFRRVTFRALVFPGTSLERSLKQTGRLIQSKSYLLGRYEFVDPLLAKIVEKMENFVPSYLSRVGGSLYRLRNETARVRQSLSSHDSLTFSNAMRDWSKQSANTIFRVASFAASKRFDDVAEEELSGYLRFCDDLEQQLLRISVVRDEAAMAGDTF